MNYRKNEHLCLFFILRSEFNCDKENHDYKHCTFAVFTRGFFTFNMSNLTCVLIYNLRMVLKTAVPNILQYLQKNVRERVY